MSRLPGSDDVLADPEGFWRFQGLTLIAGVDEVGRGPLAGPVVAAAVILPAGVAFPGLRDSKRLSPEIRLDLDGQIRRQALALAIHAIGPRQIERQGILAASLTGHGPGGTRPGPGPGNGPGGRPPAPAPDLPPATGDQGGRPLSLHRRGLRGGQGLSGPADGGRCTSATPNTTSPGIRATPPPNTWRPCAAGAPAPSTAAPSGA